MDALLIDPARLWSDLMTMGAIGALPNGGSDRMALTDADRDARGLFAHWCGEAGLVVSIDAVGNMFARREGREPGLPPVMAGSHLDTQSPGGKFDGILGVLGALEAIRALDRAGIATRRPIDVVNWTNEEGARFSPGIMGSAVFAGLLPLDTALGLADRDGRRLGDELARIRYAGDAAVGGQPVDSYFELHIEQGPLLEAAGTVIGAVTHSHYSAYYDLECRGANAHISSMPMLRRRNALVGAARLIAEIDRIGMAAAPAGSASATVIDIRPNNRINIPHVAQFSFGLVHPDEAGLVDMLAAIDEATRRIATETGLDFVTISQRRRDPHHFDPSLTAQTEAVAASLGLSCMTMRTRPGHDAFSMLSLCPAALIFVPCRDGLSHSEFEWCEPEHAAAGCAVLAETVRRRADA